MSNVVYKIVNEKIIKMLEEGTAPWKKPWNAQGTPMNLLTKIPYRGVNTWLLSATSFKSPYWITWNQVQKIGGSVKRDQAKNYEMVVFWKMLKYTELGVDDEKTFPLLRYFRVYNLDQVDLSVDQMEKLVFRNETRYINSIEAAQSIVNNYIDKPYIDFGHPKASYSPTFDKITMPSQGWFKSDEEYYATLFHELIHSTGSETRLKRFRANDFALFGDATYSKEELVAEMGASYLAAMAGIETKTLDNAAAYLKGWLTALKSDDGRMLVFAASRAQKAADYILKSNEVEETEDE